MRISVLSLFPGYFDSPCKTSLLGRAQKSGLLDLQLVDIRDYATDAHATVDDRAYGGGPGMVLMAEPVAAALRDVTKTPARRRVLYMTPQGAPLTAERCRGFAAYEELVILCGHYEGIDERVLDAFVDEEVSIGDYVLTNGCLAALVTMDATLRFVPGVVGKEASTQEDSFEQGLFDHPHYTRPAIWEGRPVPEVILSGDHQEIERWRKAKAREKTANVRPDLFMRHMLSEREGVFQVKEKPEPLLKRRLEAIVLQVACLKQTKKFYRNVLRWKLRAEDANRLVFSLGENQTLEFIEGSSADQLKPLLAPEREATFVIPSEAMHLDAALIASSKGYEVAKGTEALDGILKIKMIWWEDPDGYRWLFTPRKEERGEIDEQ